MNTQLKSVASAAARISIGLLASALLAATPASAAKVGYYDLETGKGEPYQVAAITAAGHTPVQLFTLSAAELASVDVLFALNPSNFGYGAEYLGALGTIENAVNNGLILVFGDRRVTEAAKTIPGASLVTFVRDPVVDGLEGDLGPSADINIIDNSTLVTNGPGGTVTDTNLDGGNFSNHGHAVRTTLPAGSRAILKRTSADEVMTFSYQLGAGAVVYTTVPVDFYLTGSGVNPPADAFRDIYTPNLIAYGASLAEQSTLGPISLRYCHSAAHTGDPTCTREVGGQTLLTTGKVASQDLPDSACAAGQPVTGTASVRIIADDKIAFTWANLDCGSAAGSGNESFAVNHPISTPTVGNVVQLHSERPSIVVRLRVVPRETEYDWIDNLTKGIKRIVVESLNDGKLLEKWAVNGDERISVALTNVVPNDVMTNVAVRFWVGHTKLFGIKTITARAYLNGTQVGSDVSRDLSAMPKTTFSDLQVYTPGDFGNNVFDKIEFRAGAGDYFGIHAIDLNTARPASP